MSSMWKIVQLNNTSDRNAWASKVGVEEMTAFGCERRCHDHPRHHPMRCALSAGLFVKESSFNGGGGGGVSTTAIKQLSFSQHTAAVVNKSKNC
ncbi:hypothetical protein T11_15624 [Trichinella zimbabwensis]|uniref:Uncharacterized protein n=1 Tax=Trichinella zimbabwensis TaxID=268475 RepID=A0A0V1GZ49_9BILA|nr:hypothetical protein T11_15624 [Trichinella zimbabwensis]